MKLQPDKEHVQQFCYYEKQANEDIGSFLQPNVHFDEQAQTVVSQLSFRFVLKDCVIVGDIRQGTRLSAETEEEHQQIETFQLTETTTDHLLQPLFQLIQRLVYDVTEITFDEPGITLEFLPEARGTNAHS